MCGTVASRTNIYSSNSEDEESEEDERNRKRLLKAKKLDSDQVSVYDCIKQPDMRHYLDPQHLC